MLDLQRHSPAQFQGKTVTLEGRDYEIGPRVHEGDQGYAHLLYNKVSGLCLHTIQIRREYRSTAQALRASLEKELGTGKLRDALRAEGKAHEVIALSVRRGHGGSFELHEIPWGFFREDAAPPARAEIGEAEERRSRGDHAGAAQLLRGVMSQHPNHTVALYALAFCHEARKEYEQALEAIERAVAVEPNSADYRGAQLAIQLHSPSRQVVPRLYKELERLFPEFRDYDHYGVYACLQVGDPASARQILSKGGIVPAQAAQISAQVENATAARRRYEELDRRLAQSQFRDPAPAERLRELQELHALCPEDPNVRAALGFTLRETGDERGAVPLLGSATSGIDERVKAHCYANAAYCMLRLDEWQHGMLFLSTALRLHELMFNGFQVDMLPGLVQWITLDGGVIEYAQPSATELIAAALRSCPDKSLVTPAMERLRSHLTRQ